MILIDTSVWIDFFRGRNSVQARWFTAAIDKGNDICICGIIWTEILQGIQSQRQLKTARHLLESLTYLITERRSYTLAADIYRAARARGKIIRNTTDCIIAACAITNNIPLAQKDKDFVIIEGVSELKLLSFSGGV